MAVGKPALKPGVAGMPRGLEGQALLGLIRALADPAVAEARLERLAEAEAKAVAEHEAANEVIADANRRKAEAEEAERRAASERAALAQERADFNQQSSDAAARQGAEDRRLTEWSADLERREKTLEAGETRARAAAGALQSYLKEA